MEVSDLIAGGALLVAVIALGVSAAAAIYTKRQADAAVGNLDPEFELEAQVISAGDMGRTLRVKALNHNRSTIHITRFKFRAPDGILIAHRPSPNGPYTAPSRDVKLKYPMPVRNLERDGGNATTFQFAFRPDGTRPLPKMFYIECVVSYRKGSSRRLRSGKCSKLVEA